jgi:hypothetical protein
MKNLSAFYKFIAFICFYRSFKCHDILLKEFTITSDYKIEKPIGNIYHAIDVSSLKSDFVVVAIEPDSLDSLNTLIRTDSDTGNIYVNAQMMSIGGCIKFSVLYINDGSAVTFIINVQSSNINKKDELNTVSSTSFAVTKDNENELSSPYVTSSSTTKPSSILSNSCYNLETTKTEQVSMSEIDKDITQLKADYNTQYKCLIINSDSNVTLDMNYLYDIIKSNFEIDTILHDLILYQLTGFIVIDFDNENDLKEKNLYLKYTNEIQNFLLNNWSKHQELPNKDIFHQIEHFAVNSEEEIVHVGFNYSLARQYMIRVKLKKAGIESDCIYNIKIKDSLFSDLKFLVSKEMVRLLNKTGILFIPIIKSCQQYATKHHLYSKKTTDYFFSTKTKMPATNSNTNQIQNWIGLIGSMNLKLILIVSVLLTVIIFSVIIFLSTKSKDESSENLIKILTCAKFLLPKSKISENINVFNNSINQKNKKYTSSNTIESRVSFINSIDDKSNANSLERKQEFFNQQDVRQENNFILNTFSNDMESDSNINTHFFSSKSLNESLLGKQFDFGGFGNQIDPVVTKNLLKSNIFDKHSFSVHHNYQTRQSSNNQSICKWCNLLDWTLEFNSVSNVFNDLSQLQ